MKLTLPARCHHNPNKLPTSFHIRKVKSCNWKLYTKLCMTRLIAMVKLTELPLRSFSSVMVVCVYTSCGWSAICFSCDDVIWIAMELRFMLLCYQTLPPSAACKLLLDVIYFYGYTKAYGLLICMLPKQITYIHMYTHIQQIIYIQ